VTLTDNKKFGAVALADGRIVLTTLAASRRLHVVPDYVVKLAEKHGLQRFASRAARGGLAYYYLEDEIEQLAAERRQIVPLTLDKDEIVAHPFVPKDASATEGRA